MNHFDGFEEPTSRAFWVSDDLTEDSTAGPTFTLEWLTESPSSIKTLVVVSGKIVTDIVDKYVVGNAERVCTVNSTEEFNVAALCKCSEDVYVCSVSKTMDITAAGRLVHAISEILSKSEKIIAFTDEMMSRLNGADRDSAQGSTLWRSLSTRKGREQQLSTVPRLQQPNFIFGVAAGVIGYAENRDIPATVNILYVAEDAYETELIASVLKVFTETTNFCLPKIDASSKKFDNNKLNLYI